MTAKNKIRLFQDAKVRSAWDSDAEKWYISIVDVVQVLTGSIDGRKYWNKLKQRLKEEGNETVTNCHQLKMPAADGKMRLTDVADVEQLLRLIQSIPSPKAEPFKLWLAQLGRERLDQLQDPELSTKDISEATNPETLNQHADVARQGGQIARNARLELEQKTGQKVVTSLNAKRIKSLENK